MERIIVKSSYLNAIGYDEETLTLDVETKDGRIYRFLGIQPHIVQTLLNAPSKGRYYRSVISRMPHSRIR